MGVFASGEIDQGRNQVEDGSTGSRRGLGVETSPHPNHAGVSGQGRDKALTMTTIRGMEGCRRRSHLDDDAPTLGRGNQSGHRGPCHLSRPRSRSQKRDKPRNQLDRESGDTSLDRARFVGRRPRWVQHVDGAVGADDTVGPLEPGRNPTEMECRAGAHPRRTTNGLTLDPGAIAGAEILELETTVSGPQGGVAARHRGIGENHIAGRGGANDDLRSHQVHTQLAFSHSGDQYPHGFDGSPYHLTHALGIHTFRSAHGPSSTRRTSTCSRLRSSITRTVVPEASMMNLGSSRRALRRAAG